MSQESREARRAYHERMEKETVRLVRRFLTVSRGIHSSEKVELEKPIFNGYERSYKVRDDIARSSEGPNMKRVLEIVQHTIYSSNKKFIYRPSYRSKEYKPKEQNLRVLSEHEFQKVPDDLKKYFHQFEKQFTWGGPRMVWGVRQPWKFVLEVKKHYKTHVRLTHPELESEYVKLSDKLWNHDALAYRYGDISGARAEGKSWRKKQRAKDREEERKIIDEALEEYLEDKHWDEMDSYSPW